MTAFPIKVVCPLSDKTAAPFSRGNHMKKVTSETFHESLIAQYRDQIMEALIESESEHRTRMDIGKLNFKLTTITKAAVADGLSEGEIDRLIEETHTYHSNVAKAA